MTSPTRNEFLNHVHQELVHPEPDKEKKKGSPTKSTQRCRWRELLPWDVEADARVYWEALSDDEKNAILAVLPGYWEFVQHQLNNYQQPITSEPSLRLPFSIAFQLPHNTAIKDAGDMHAEMWTEGSHPEPQPLANADLIMVYDGKLCGVIELKTWWKVTEADIEEVRQGNRFTMFVLTEGQEPLKGDHHGRLAIEQTYGYMCVDKVCYGIMATFNAFVLLKRQTGGILFMSRTIPINSTNPTILKLLYFFSHLCALHPEPHPELNSEGIAITLKPAPKTPDKAPKIPDPNYHPPARTSSLAPADLTGEPRRSPRFQGSTSSSTDVLSLDAEKLIFLGCKGWRGTLNNGSRVFLKLWDGWKLPASDSEHEACVYYRLRDLWSTVVPDFLGVGQWGFYHILLLSDIDVSCPLSFCCDSLMY